MPNDLRDPQFRPAPKPANPGCGGNLFAIVCSVFIILGVLMLIGGAGFFSVIWIAMSVGILVNGQKQFKKAQQKRPVRPAAPRQSPEACPNPEPHRHFDQAKVCPNPEPHRHSEAPRPAAPKACAQPAQSKQYDTFVQPAKEWPTDTERRLENRKALYEAGLLTREEYEEELRKLQIS